MKALWKNSVQQRDLIALAIVLCLVMVACDEARPMKIGFVCGMTGRVADLGIAGRDGVIFAIEEKNRAGGIGGRMLELVVRDDHQDNDRAQRAVGELLEEDVLAIIGPMTSSMAVVIKPVIDAGKTVTVSPTVKTDQLSAQDDYFLRVTVPLSSNARLLAGQVVDNLDLHKVAVVYDVSNRAFTETWVNYFAAALQEQGGEVIVTEEFTSSPSVHFMPIAQRIMSSSAEAVLLLSNAIDTALLAQQLNKLGSRMPLFSSEWAFTTDLISFGGRAVDGMSSYHSFNANSQDPRYLAFKKGFLQRFGYAPAFASVLAYDAASFLFAGLEKNPAREGLKASLLELESYQGLQSDFKVDRFGDVERKLFLTVVDGGQFRVVD
jgi:branched-chain amino acid transport system substrate-binding protein